MLVFFFTVCDKNLIVILILFSIFFFLDGSEVPVVSPVAAPAPH